MTGQKQTQKQDRTQPTRRRSDAGQVRLTLRDLEALRWIAEQYVIAGSALPLLLRVAPGGARKWTQRMRRAGLIQSAVVNWTTWYWPTARAMHDLDLAWPATRPKAVQLPHLRAVGAVRLWHAASTPQLHWWLNAPCGRGSNASATGFARRTPNSGTHPAASSSPPSRSNSMPSRPTACAP